VETRLAERAASMVRPGQKHGFIPALGLRGARDELALATGALLTRHVLVQQREAPIRR
jgi:hypothetical protein